MSGEADKHNWTAEEITALIEWRGANESVFTGKRNSSKSGWEAFVNQAEFKITDKQAKKKWNNLKEKYKELRDPPPGKGVEAVTAATWQWYASMDAALQEQHSINPPLVAAANMTSTAGGVRASSAPARKRAKPAPRKRAGDLLDFLKMQAEKEEERESQALQREEERERAAAARSEKFLSLFEKLVDKL